MKRKIETAVADGQARAKQLEAQRNDQYREQFATSVLHVSAALSGRRWTVRIDRPRDPVSVPRPYQFSGSGVAVTPFFHLDGGLARFQIHSAGSTDNFSVVLMSAKGEYIDLLANSTESYDGSKGVDISEPGVYVAFVSAGRRSWSIRVE